MMRYSRWWQSIVFVIGLNLSLSVLSSPSAQAQSSSAYVDALLRQLKDANPEVRYGAIDALMQRKPLAEPAISALTNALQDPNLGVRRNAADALGRLGPVGVPSLIQALKEKDPKTRSDAAAAMLNLGAAGAPVVPLLANALKDSDPDVRRSATGTLASLIYQLGPAKAPVSQIMGALKDKDPEVRSSAARMLGSMGPTAIQAVNPIAELLKDKITGVRQSAIDALSKLGRIATPAIRAIVAALTDPSPGVRRTAAQTLGELGPVATPAVPKIFALLNDKDAMVRQSAFEALGELGPIAAPTVPGLILLLKDKDPDARCAAVDTLGRLGSVAAPTVPQLVEFLKDKDIYIWAAATAALGRLGPVAAPAVPQLVEFLKDKDIYVRYAAVYVLTRLGNIAKPAQSAITEAVKEDARLTSTGVLAQPITSWISGMSITTIAQPRATVPELIVRLKDKDPTMRITTVDALASLGVAATLAVPTLVKTLKDDNAGVRQSAIDALKTLGATAVPALPQIIAILKDQRPEARRAGVEALGNVGRVTASGVPELIAMLKDPDSGVRATAALALGKWGPGASLSLKAITESGEDTSHITTEQKNAITPTVVPIVEMLKDRVPTVRRAATEALGNLGPIAAPALPTISTYLKDIDHKVRLSAISALVKMGMVATPDLVPLARALQDQNIYVRSAATQAVGTMSHTLSHNAPKMEPGTLQASLDSITKAESTLSALESDEHQDANSIQTALEAIRGTYTVLKAESRRRFWASVEKWMQSEPWLWPFLFWGVGALLVVCSLYIVPPLWILAADDRLSFLKNLSLPESLNGVKESPRYLLAVGLFASHDKVLDAFVSKYATTVKEKVGTLKGANSRLVSVSFPNIIKVPTPMDFHNGFQSAPSVVLIRSESEDKTALAHHMAVWALGDQGRERLCKTHRMIPVLLQAPPEEKAGKEVPLLKRIGVQLQEVIGAAEPPSDALVQNLLRKRRVLVVVEGLSEQGESIRQAVLSGDTALPLNALIVTSRNAETFRTVTPLTVEIGKIKR
jgi:HEAT repeat protein